MDLTQIKDSNLRKRLYEIAKTDGGANPEEIDFPKGIQDLSLLLSKGLNGRKLNSTEQLVIQGLFIEYQSKIGTNNKAKDGDNITVTGSNNITTGRINNSNVIIGNNNNIVINEINPKTTHTKKLNSTSKTKGAVLAKLLFDETVNSLYADNDAIVNIINKVDKKTAYSFLKEYQRLSNNKSNIIQDLYNISDIFNRITLKESAHIINSLLQEAQEIGLKDNEAYKNLKQYSINIKNKKNKDPTKNEEIQLDYTIQTLLDEMSEIYGDTK